MLYKQICAVSLTAYAFLTSPARGGDYHVSSRGNTITCTEDANSICNIHCDNVAKKGMFSCGNAGECNFYCEEKKCAEGSTITASNAGNLNVIVGANGEECMKTTTVNAPNFGNATFDMGNSKKGFKSMKVYAGTDTQNIKININSNTVVGDDCKGMEVYASTADYVQITLGNGLEWEAGKLECPVDSPYSGPNPAPCVVDASNGNGIIVETNFIAPDGIPTNLYINGGIFQGTNTITCSNVGSSSTTFDENSECWQTFNPTNDPTLSPSRNPTLNPLNSDPPTTNPSNSPTKNPIIAPTVTESTNNPSIAPTVGPVIGNTNNPSTVQSRIPTISLLPSTAPLITNNPTNIPTETPKYWFCDDCSAINIRESLIQIEVSYWFSEKVEYNLHYIQCFLHTIFIEWFARYQFVDEFGFCHIDIVDVIGGTENNDDTFCRFGPCIDTKRRLLQSFDGNTTMTILTHDSNTYVLINGLSLDSMANDFETAFLDNFGFVMNVEIFVENEDTNTAEPYTKNSENMSMNPLYIIILISVFVFCCIASLLFCFCYKRRRKKAAKVSFSGTETIEGYGMNDIITETKPSTNTKQTKLRHKRSNTIDSWDISTLGNKQSISHQQMFGNKIYTDGMRKNKPRSETEDETGIMNAKQSIEMFTRNQLYTDGQKKHKRTDLAELSDASDASDEPSIPSQKVHNNHGSDWQNYNFNAYNDGMNQYTQNVSQQTQYTHHPRQETAGINSIQPKIVNKLTKKYNRKQSERIEDESTEESSSSDGMTGTESDSDSESSTNTLSGNSYNDEKDLLSDNEEDGITHQIESDTNDLLDHDIAEQIGDGDILRNIGDKRLLSFQQIDCENDDEDSGKRPTGSIIVHRD